MTTIFILQQEKKGGIANTSYTSRIMPGLGHGIRMEMKVSLASQFATGQSLASYDIQ